MKWPDDFFTLDDYEIIDPHAKLESWRRKRRMAKRAGVVEVVALLVLLGMVCWVVGCV